jgi:hypothetical protein
MNADEIRQFCFDNYVTHALTRGDFSITLRAGTIRDNIPSEDRPELPAICAALGANAFSDNFNLRRIHVEGPLNGANTYLTFLLLKNI